MLAQSPACTTPTDNGHGRSVNGAGGSTFRSASRRRSAACTCSNSSTALTPCPARDPCVALPRTSRRNVSDPAFALTTVPAVGSAIRHARPVWPRRSVANVPRPPSSSPTTRCTANGLVSRSPTARTAARIATTPPFMSHVPRPYQRPSASCRNHGSWAVHQAASPGGTTSTCPFSTSSGTVLPAARGPEPPGRQVPTQPHASSRSTSSPG